MNAASQKQMGVAWGLIVLGLTAIAALLVIGLIPNSPKPLGATTQAPVKHRLELALPDAATADYLSALDQYAPITAQMLRLEASQAIGKNASQNEVAALILNNLLSQFQTRALDLRSASVRDYDAILWHVRDGLRALSAQESGWCQATVLEHVLKNEPTEVITTFLEEFTYDGAAYRWLLEWGDLYLAATSRARQQPVRHGRLSGLDKAVLQQRGMELGASQWTLALQIATFSQAEGAGYRQMREVIDTIDVCRLGITAVDLSDRIPAANRGRIWADLMPEIFYGNTPYVIARVTDYFFIS